MIFTSPTRLFRALAFAEAVTWTLLLAGMFAKYVLKIGELGVAIGGPVHGLVFLAYCFVVVLVAIDQHWGLPSTAVGLMSAVVPFATVWFEKWATRRDILGAKWRLRERAPQTVLERVVAWGVNNATLAAVGAAIAVSATFGLLLLAGPPTTWFA